MLLDRVSNQPSQASASLLTTRIPCLFRAVPRATEVHPNRSEKGPVKAPAGVVLSLDVAHCVRATVLGVTIVIHAPLRDAEFRRQVLTGGQFWVSRR
jgi:hypothetical protein